jgi:hypothetical protein
VTFGTQSAIFRSFLSDALGATASFTPQLASGGTWQAALFSNTPTPDNDAVSANCAYNAGAWLATSEVTDTDWPAGGVALTWASTTRWHPGDTASTVWFAADNTSSSGSVTMSGVWGDLVYNNALTTPVAQQALAYHSFGAAKSVTAGIFTIQWSSSGVVSWTQFPA